MFVPDEDLAEQVKELNSRIMELERMLSAMIGPFQKVQNVTGNYFRLIQLLLEHGGLTPDVLTPDVKDPIARDIVRVLMDRTDQNISEITELVRSRRGTASRRIIRKKLGTLEEKKLVEKKQKASRYVYRLSEEMLKKWSKLLGLKI